MRGKRGGGLTRRRQGGRLLLMGIGPGEVAKRVGVSRQTAYSWKAALARSENLEAFAVIDRGGRPARLGPVEREWLGAAVCELPVTHQLPGQRWTLKLVQRLIDRRFGVSLSLAQISRVLRQLDLSTRDASAIARANKRMRERSRA